MARRLRATSGDSTKGECAAAVPPAIAPGAEQSHRHVNPELPLSEVPVEKPVSLDTQNDERRANGAPLSWSPLAGTWTVTVRARN